MSKSLHMAGNGMYGVLLHDRENCTDPEIKSLISQFGKVREYHRVAKNGGDLVFVHFQEYEEAKACLERLEKDPMFYAMPARPREGRIPKPLSHRENARSLPRVTQDEGKKKSILRTRSLAKPASQRDSSSSDEHDGAKGGDKGVRLIVRPGDILPPVRRRSLSRGSDYKSGELSLFKESSGDRPPHLLNLTDVWTEKFTEESGIPTSTELLIFNLPLHITDGLIYALCDQVASVLSVEVHRDQFDNLPFYWQKFSGVKSSRHEELQEFITKINLLFVFAAVQLRSPNDAKILKKFLHRRALKGKVLYVVFSSDFQ